MNSGDSGGNERPMDGPEATTVYASRVRVFVLLLLSIVFVAIGLWMLNLGAESVGVAGFMMAWVCVGFFSLCGLLALIPLISSKPALVIDHNGIMDNASGLAAGFIPWSDVEGVSVLTYKNQKFLSIAIRTSDEFISRFGLLKRVLMRANSSIVGHAVNIPQVVLPVRVEDLLERIVHFARMDANRTRQ